MAGAGVALWLIRPLKARPVAFGVLLGGLLGGGAASLQQVGGTSVGILLRQGAWWFSYPAQPGSGHLPAELHNA